MNKNFRKKVFRFSEIGFLFTVRIVARFSVETISVTDVSLLELTLIYKKYYLIFRFIVNYFFKYFRYTAMNIARITLY